MTIVPMMRRCPVCHKRYSWNPDVGQFRCPYCGGIGEAKKDILSGLIEKLKKGKRTKKKRYSVKRREKNLRFSFE